MANYGDIGLGLMRGVRQGIETTGSLYGLMRQKEADEREKGLMPLRKQALEQELERGKITGEKSGLELQALKDYNAPVNFDDFMKPFRDSDKVGVTLAEEIAIRGGYLDPANRTIKKGDLTKVREVSSTPEMMKQRALLTLNDINAQLKATKPEDPVFTQLTEKKNYLEKMYKLEEDFEAVPLWDDKSSSWKWFNKKNGQPAPQWGGMTPKEVQVELLKEKEAAKRKTENTVKVYDSTGNLSRMATPNADGTITLKPGETTQEPRKPNLLTPEEEAQRIRIAKAKKEEMGGGNIPDIPGGSVPGEINKKALEGATSGEQAIVKQLVEYKMPLPSGFALKSPYWQNIMQRAALYDPSFDASQYNVRLKLRNDFNSGKAAQNIRSLNTAVAHLDELDKAAKGLNNASAQLWNKVANFGLTQAGDSRVTKFLAAATAVEGELANVFKNTGATDQEIKAWRANLDSSQSPKQLKGSIDTVISLLGGRLGALQNQYETGMGKQKDFKMLSDKSRGILTRIGVDVNAIDPVKKAATGESTNTNLMPSTGGAKKPLSAY